MARGYYIIGIQEICLTTPIKCHLKCGYAIYIRWLFWANFSFKHQHFHIQNETCYYAAILLLGIYPTETDTDVRNEHVWKYLLQKLGNNAMVRR